MNSQGKTYSKLKWTPEEEQHLRFLRQEKLIESWKSIANQMNQICVQKNRSGKQCRQRYMNYVRFGNQLPKTIGWTPDEDEQLFLKFMEHGAKWVQIGKQMPGRSENCLKNRFYGAMRKIIRKINRVTKQKKLRQKKPIKTDLLIRVLEYEHKQLKNQQNDRTNVKQFLQGLKKQMIKTAINPDENFSSQQIQSLINGISRFCSITKPSNSKKTQPKIKQQPGQNIFEVVEQQQLQNIQNQQKQLQENQQQQINNENRSSPEIRMQHKIVSNVILFSNQSIHQSCGSAVESQNKGLLNLKMNANVSTSTVSSSPANSWIYPTVNMNCIYQKQNSQTEQASNSRQQPRHQKS